MMAPGVDESRLLAMYMVWPFNQRPAAPQHATSDDYLVLPCRDPDLASVRGVIDADLPVSDPAWKDFRDRIFPGGAFLGLHIPSGKPVATASVAHNPRAARFYFPFGGEVGYVTVDPEHRGKRVQRAVVAQVVGRLLKAGYRHIFVGVQSWRLPAVRLYLGLGFVPFLHDEGLLPRWRRICEQIGWGGHEREWPQSLSSVATCEDA